MTRPSESTHWYTRDAEPLYEIAAAKGGKRATTLKDARKYGLYPSVTSIIRCAAAPGLENWKQDQVLMAALTLPRQPGESDESFCRRVIEDSGEQARKARDRGTEIHAAIQGHFEGKAPDEEMWPFARGASMAVMDNFPAQDWHAERSFAHPLGYGGKVDLHGQSAVIDFKGSDFDEAKAPTLKTWDEHAMQLAAYREGLGLAGADCAIVYVSRTVPGLCRVIRIDEAELTRGWDMFRGLLNYWQANRGYWPALWKPTDTEVAA